jgi:hypothetical protein
MYLIFKRRVMLTTNSQFVHDFVPRQVIESTFTDKKKKDIREFVMELSDATKNQYQEHRGAAAAANPIGKLLQNTFSVLPRASELAGAH